MNVLKACPTIDFEEKAKLQSFQLEKLKEQLNYVNQHAPFYQNLFRSNAINVSEINSWEDFRKIPFTTKDDFSQQNLDFLCVDNSQIADFTSTSGTTGSPVPFYLTADDLERLAKNEALSMLCTGANSNDVFQLMTTIDKRFMAGLAYYLGVQKIGAGIIRNGPGALSLQWDSILRFKPTVLIAVPGFIPSLIKYAKENGIDYKSSSVKKIICIGQPIRTEELALNELGKAIKNEWDVQLHSTYASTEMGAAFTECEIGKGGHLPSELVVLEVVDNNENQVKNGEAGEVIVTTLGVQAMPLIRYKTGDICHFYEDACECGRKTPRLGPIIGRKNQMLKVKGTTIFPNMIYAILEKMIPENSYYVAVSKGDFLNDNVAIKIDETYSSLKQDLQEKLQSGLRFLPELEFSSITAINGVISSENSRKPIKFIDLR